LNDWSNYINTLNPDSDLQVALNLSEENVEFVLDMVDTFLIIFKEDENIARTNSFTLLRTSIINTKSALENAGSSLESAKDTVKRAELSASGNIVSASDAQIKQALGSLRAAQANFAKTILKTPISGTINSLSVRPGDFINSFTQVGVVANNSALEIVTFVSDDELPLIKEGETVTVENEFVGTVTQIAPAVDINTRKTEVRITLSDTDIANGDTVKITKDLSINESTDIKVQVPLTAIKFAREDGSVFFVEDGVAKSRSVTLGNILGNSVEVTGGLNQNEEFIVDVRGLVEGENVQIDN
jgi:RND family efflux transporter MFP subunit